MFQSHYYVLTETNVLDPLLFFRERDQCLDPYYVNTETNVSDPAQYEITEGGRIHSSFVTVLFIPYLIAIMKD